MWKMVHRERHRDAESSAERTGDVPSPAAQARKPKRWYERTSVTLAVAAGLIVVALGFVHIITGLQAESRYELPFAIVFKKAFGYRETLVDARAIAALPYPAAKLKYPLGCEVLQQYGYLPSGHAFEARMAIGRLAEFRRWQAEFARRLGRVEQPWEQRLQAAPIETPGDSQGPDTVGGVLQ
jgi:hypothetical protein